MGETALVREIQLALAPLGFRLFRNNVGFYKIGNRAVRYGLCPGSSDLVGVHAPTGRAVFIEVKTLGGKLSKEQDAFLKAMIEANAIAFTARSVFDAVRWAKALA